MHISRAFLIMANRALQVAAQAPTATKTTLDLYAEFHADCASVIRSVRPKITGAPAPDMAISELAVSFAIGTLYNTENPCELPVVTGSSAELFSDWASSWTEWQSKHVPEFQEIWTACSDEPLIADIIPVGPEVCPNLASKIKGGGDGGGGGGSDENEDDEEEESGDSENQEDEDEEDEDEEDKKDDDSLSSRPTGSLFAAVMAAAVAIGGLY